jgi:uncharacterized membrane protein YeaQ/YmgE (transglycosylase-associated protein family)
MNLDQLQEYMNLGLTWIGFGTVVGLAAKAIMPGRDPGGSVATLMMGIVGTLIGCAILQYFNDGSPVEPVSIKGFFVGTGGALVLLIFYKVLGGYWFEEGETSFFQHKTRRRRRRQYRSVVEE